MPMHAAKTNMEYMNTRSAQITIALLSAIMIIPFTGTAKQTTKACTYFEYYWGGDDGLRLLMREKRCSAGSMLTGTTGNYIQLNGIICGYHDGAVECGAYPWEAGE